MIVWQSKHIREEAKADEIIFKRRDCEWILPLSLASHLRYNPRHLPVVPIRVRLSASALITNGSMLMLVQCIVHHAARS